MTFIIQKNYKKILSTSIFFVLLLNSMAQSDPAAQPSPSQSSQSWFSFGRLVRATVIAAATAVVAAVPVSMAVSSVARNKVQFHDNQKNIHHNDRQVLLHICSHLQKHFSITYDELKYLPNNFAEFENTQNNRLIRKLWKQCWQKDIKHTNRHYLIFTKMDMINQLDGAGKATFQEWLQNKDRKIIQKKPHSGTIDHSVNAQIFRVSYQAAIDESIVISCQKYFAQKLEILQKKRDVHKQAAKKWIKWDRRAQVTTKVATKGAFAIGGAAVSLTLWNQFKRSQAPKTPLSSMPIPPSFMPIS